MRVEVVRGDITEQDVDVVVNAANSSLLGGGGVDGAIHRAAGPDLLATCSELRRTSHVNGLPTGDVVATSGFGLPARWIVHTVGPVRWKHADGGAALLASCHHRALEAASDLRARTIAFPAISCGAYGWSADDAAPIAVAAVRAHAATHPETTVELVRFVVFDDDAYAAFTRACG